MLRQSLRQGRFRHRLLDPDFLQMHSSTLSKSVEKLYQLWKQVQISDCDFVGLYLLIFMAARRPKDFLGGPHNFPLPKVSQGIKMDEAVQILNEAAPHLNWIKLSRFANDANFIESLCSVSWRSIPYAAERALHCWLAGTYPLKLVTHLPTPEEVMAYQCEGYRCVSLLCEKTQIESYVEDGRDVLGFVIHDLIHADHFFHDPIAAQEQVEFSRRLQKIHSTQTLQEMLKQDELFTSEWNYLISDMNSVPLHLLMTLKATILGFFKRQNQIEISTPLPEHLEYHFAQLFGDTLTLWNLSAEALTAAHRLNTPAYRGHEDSVLLVEALALKS